MTDPNIKPIINTLSEFVATHILKQPDRLINTNEPLISSGLIDSFNLVDMALFIEDSFGIRIDDTELNADTFDNLKQLANIVLSRQA